jgi:hypothetical protein
MTWTATPDSPAGFWDHSACRCGSENGMRNLGRRMELNARAKKQEAWRRASPEFEER